MKLFNQNDNKLFFKLGIFHLQQFWFSAQSCKVPRTIQKLKSGVNKFKMIMENKK